VKGRPNDPKRRRRGTGHRRQAGDAIPVALVPQPESNVPEPPDDLPDEAKLMWIAVVEELQPRGLRPGDLFGIEAMVVAAYRHRQARRKIDELGILVKGLTGPMVNPLIRMERDEAATFLRWAEQFGITLSSRIRMGLLQLAGETMAQSLERTLQEE